MKTVSTKINSKLYEDLVNTCNGSGCSVSEKLRELIENESKRGSSRDMKQPSPEPSNDRIEYDGFGNKVIYRDGQKPLVIIGDKKEEIPKLRNVRIYQDGRWYETQGYETKREIPKATIVRIFNQSD